MTKKRTESYIKFYRVMLILSTIGTALATLGLFSIPQTIIEFHIAPTYSVTLLLSYVVVLVSIVALVLLWMKRIEGIRLKIGSYIAYILLAIVALLTVDPYIQYLITTTASEAGSNAAETEIALKLILNIGTYSMLVASIIVDTVFMLLWRSAWKKQVEEDS